MKFPKLNKETSLYKAGAIRTAVEDAASKATDYVTEISGGGIMVHPSGDSTSGWKIADALELIKSTVTAFSVALVSGMAKVVVGEADKSHAEIDYHSLKLVDKDGETYFHVSDLRSGAYGTVTVTESFVATETYGTVDTSYYFSNYARASDGTVSEVKVNGSTATFTTIEDYIDVGVDEPELLEVVSGIEITSALSAGDVINVTYEAIYGNLKAYTFGIRDEDGIVGAMSVAEGVGNVASGQVAHVEGKQCEATGDMSHAEGMRTKAQGYASHAEGNITIASGADAHTQNLRTRAMGKASHAEGYETIARAEYSHAQGDHTIAGSTAQTVMGRFNVEDANNAHALVIGNGTSASNRSNAFTVDWDGDVWSAGSLKLQDQSIDRDATPSADLFSDANALDLYDKDNELLGRVRIFKRSGGAAGIQLLAWNEPDGGGPAAYNGLAIQVGKDGSRSYAVSDAPAFREAIGLGRTQSNLTLSNTSAGTATLVRNAIVASLFVRSLQLGSALANGSSVTIATVPSGYRPPVMAFAHAYNTRGLFLAVESGGAVKVFNYTGASLPTSTISSATITYVI